MERNYFKVNTSDLKKNFCLECQPIVIISLLYVGQVLKGADRLVNFFVRDQNVMLIEHRPLTASGQTNTPVHFGGKLKILHGWVSY